MFDLEAIKSQIDLLDLSGHQTTLKKVSSTQGGEWAGPCPFCGGTDRFRVQPQSPSGGRWLCRHCTAGKWADALDFGKRMWPGMSFTDVCERLGGKSTLSPEERERLRRERDRHDAERQALAIAEQARRRETLDSSMAWETYHQNLSKQDKRYLWHSAGLSDTWIDYYKVGYNPGREFRHGDTAFTCASLTIPTFTPVYDLQFNLSWKCIALDHRLLDDKAPGGKYRPHVSGVGKTLFRADLFDPNIQGDVLLVEGQKKAMVTYAYIQDYVHNLKAPTPLGRLSVVGINGKSYKPEWDAELSEVERLWICLDPDADREARQIAARFESANIVRLPDKIDDLFVDGILSPDELWDMMQTSEKF